MTLLSACLSACLSVCLSVYGRQMGVSKADQTVCSRLIKRALCVVLVLSRQQVANS